VRQTKQAGISWHVAGLILFFGGGLRGQVPEACFQDPLLVSLRTPSQIATLDADGDGNKDLVSLPLSAPDLVFLYGQGGGRFESPVNLAGTSNLVSFAEARRLSRRFPLAGQIPRQTI
jgi:hypothetical protein